MADAFESKHIYDVAGPAEEVSTDAWKLSVPTSVTDDSPLLVIPTVHPRGDRRIIRCAQVALDAGFRLQFVWLGDGRPSSHPAVGETILKAPRSRRERLFTVRQVAEIARQYDAVAWHIHDFYFLAQARRWHRRTSLPVLYDVHEYYGKYYAAMVPVPERIKRVIARALETYQVNAAKRIGAASVVTELMASSFRKANVPVIVSPNYPFLEHFERARNVPFKDRCWRVLHIGTLTSGYGTSLLVSLAKRSLERGLPFEFLAIARFPSSVHQFEFEKLVQDAGMPENLELIAPRATHEVPDLIAGAGFGLSLLAPGGQNDTAVPSKNYEHVMLGLVDVVTDRTAQRQFVEAHAIGVIGVESDPDYFLDEMLRIAEVPDAFQSDLDAKANAARQSFTWEGGVAPRLARMLLDLTIVSRRLG